MLKRAIITSSICVLMCVAADAQADDGAVTAPTGRPGVYVEANGVFAFASTDGDLDFTDFGESFGANARIGYRWNAKIATEVQGEWIDEFDLQDGAGGVETWSVGANAKYFFSDGAFQPYLLVGAHYYDLEASLAPNISEGRGVSEVFEADESGLGLRLGGGIDWYSGEHLYINTGIESLLGINKLKDFDYVGLLFGLGYRI